MKEPAGEARPVVLMVDDDNGILELIAIGAARYRPPFDIRFASSAAEACEKLSERCYDALVLDVNLLGPTGVTVAAQAHEKCPQMPKAFYTAYDRSVTHEHAARFGMETWSKPLTAPQLFERITSLLASRQTEGGVEASGKLSVPSAVAAIAGAVLGTVVGR